jgi:hypothetical protein
MACATGSTSRAGAVPLPRAAGLRSRAVAQRAAVRPFTTKVAAGGSTPGLPALALGQMAAVPRRAARVAPGRRPAPRLAACPRLR